MAAKKTNPSDTLKAIEAQIEGHMKTISNATAIVEKAEAKRDLALDKADDAFAAAKAKARGDFADTVKPLREDCEAAHKALLSFVELGFDINVPDMPSLPNTKRQSVQQPLIEFFESNPGQVFRTPEIAEQTGIKGDLGPALNVLVGRNIGLRKDGRDGVLRRYIFEPVDAEMADA